ncbi:hypothetical protein ZOSMA_2G03000 [Zostera marina]|uniref:Uncharacterized protein n=1 Tax=Zostera marina TaxID=29655 RepID=A0A0K9PDH2_ZOSMR|nr:hypothetical protein ZOSMA_2G03000 [Zostera marina]
MYTVACETSSRLQALENEKLSLANQVSHLSSVNERLLSELQTSQQLYLTEGFQRCQYMCGKMFPDLDFNQVPYTEDKLTERLLSGWLLAMPSTSGLTTSPAVWRHASFMLWFFIGGPPPFLFHASIPFSGFELILCLLGFCPLGF